MGNSLFVKNCRELVTCDEQDRILHHVNMLVEDGFITYIGTEEKEADTILDASNMAVYPGLINAHHHLYQIFSRNLPEVQDLELFDWLTALYEVWKNLKEETVYYSSAVGMAELMKNGCTTCFDHNYVFPKDVGDLTGQQFRAADDLGIRFYTSRGSMNLSKKDGGLPPDSVVQSTEEILQDSQRLIEKYHDPSRGSMHMIALAPCSPFSVTEDLLRESAALARDKKVRLHTHLCETLDEEAYMLEREGMRPVAYMEKLGWVGNDVWYAHGIHFNDEELKLLADTGTGVCHCPISNMKLSSGIARIPEMLSLGVKVGLGVDGSASNDGSSLMEEMRVAYLLHRLHASKKAPSGYDILKMATKGSAQVLGREELGSLAVGMAGDFFMIDMRKLELTGAMYDPGSVFGTVGYRQPVDYTVVAGKVTVSEGRLVGFEEEVLAEKAGQTVREYLRR